MGEYVQMIWEGGWKDRPNDNGSIFMCYGFDVDRVTKEYITETIEYLFSKNWFYDFVTKEKIFCAAESK